jgi:hypothetical protein
VKVDGATTIAQLGVELAKLGVTGLAVDVVAGASCPFAVTLYGDVGLLQVAGGATLAETVAAATELLRARLERAIGGDAIAAKFASVGVDARRDAMRENLERGRFFGEDD